MTLLGPTPDQSGRPLRRDSGHRADADQLVLSARSGLCRTSLKAVARVQRMLRRLCSSGPSRKRL